MVTNVLFFTKNHFRRISTNACTRGTGTGTMNVHTHGIYHWIYYIPKVNGNEILLEDTVRYTYVRSTVLPIKKTHTYVVLVR